MPTCRHLSTPRRSAPSPSRHFRGTRNDCSRLRTSAQSVHVYRLSEDQKDTFRAHMPSVLILSTDGGADHSKTVMRSRFVALSVSLSPQGITLAENTFISNQAATLATQIFLKVFKVILFRYLLNATTGWRSFSLCCVAQSQTTAALC